MSGVAANARRAAVVSVAVATVLLTSASSEMAFAEDGLRIDEVPASKLDTVKVILGRRAFTLLNDSTARSMQCSRLLQALMTGKGIRVVKPSAETDDPKDPRFKHYEACGRFDPDKWPDGAAGADKTFFGLSSPASLIGDKQFKIYRLVPRSGTRRAREFLYAEMSPQRFWELSGSGYRDAYNVVDTDGCSTLGRAFVESGPLPGEQPGRFLQRLNMLFLFEDNYFVLDLRNVLARGSTDPPAHYSLGLMKYDDDRTFELICDWY